jgi:hypothetical protein
MCTVSFHTRVNITMSTGKYYPFHLSLFAGSLSAVSSLNVPRDVPPVRNLSTGGKGVRRLVDASVWLDRVFGAFLEAQRLQLDGAAGQGVPERAVRDDLVLCSC